MIPVVMFVINAGVLSSVFLTFFPLTMACTSFKHVLVMYLMMFVATAIMMSNGTIVNSFFYQVIVFTQMTYLMLSLLINIYAMSIIALKAWCVRVHGVFGKKSLTKP
jgi:hypothetical protein